MRRTGPASSRLDLSIGVLVVGLVGGTIVVWFEPPLPRVADARSLDIAINVAATVVGAAVAILGWVRWRQTGQSAALYQSAAFNALTVVNALALGVVFAGQEVVVGLSAERPGEAPVLLWTLTRLVAAVLLVVGAMRTLRREGPALPHWVVGLAPSVLLALSGVLLFGREAAQEATLLGPAAESIGMLVVQVAIFALFLAAAVAYRRLYVRERFVAHAFLTAGLVVAAFSQLHFMLDPVVAIGIVSSTDVLRLGFYAILFIGIQAELEADLAAQRRANQELVRLREVDADNATLAERSRLAREIHDGLAQSLWYAKLKQGRLVQDGALDEDRRATAQEVLGAIDSALAEARHALMAMRTDGSSASGFEELVRALVDDFEDRFGIRTEFTSDARLPELPSRTQAELLRIVQEALANVRRHADATVVRVHVGWEEGIARLSVGDNGRGFDPTDVPPGRFGLQGMRERAALVGAALEIDTQPRGGTRVHISIASSKAAAP